MSDLLSRYVKKEEQSIFEVTHADIRISMGESTALVLAVRSYSRTRIEHFRVRPSGRT